MKQFPYPKSFPNKDEELFVRLLLSSTSDFPLLWQEWKKTIVFDDIEQALFRLLPVLYLRLKEHDIHDELTGRIKGVYKLVWVKNQRLLDAMKSTVVLLKQHDIEVILLKGIPLLIEVYKDAGARFVNDVDILIHPRNTKKAITVMKDAGWIIKSGQFPGLDRFSDETLPRVVKEITFVNEQYMEVDVHWRVFETLGDIHHREVMLFDTLYSTGHAIQYGGASYRMPSFEDLLIHIIVHGAEGSPTKTLRWTVDAVTIIRTASIDWEALLQKVISYDFVIEVRTALLYLDEERFVEIPRTVIDALLKIAVEPRLVKAYYKKANSVHVPWGGLPRLWRTYWRYESPDKSPKSFYHFLHYLTGAWGLSRKRDLVPFVMRKYKDRISYHLKKAKIL